MDLFIQTLDSAIRLSTPLIFACLAGLYSERAGIFDIGLEGKMLAFLPAMAYQEIGVLDLVHRVLALWIGRRCADDLQTLLRER